MYLVLSYLTYYITYALENGLCFQEAEDQLLKYDDGVNGNESAQVEHSKEETGAGIKFGWIEGVLV